MSMKHSGRALQSALKLIFCSLLLLLAVCVIPIILVKVIGAISIALLAVWVIFALFTLYFFRDPDAKTPQGPGLVVSPGHGKVDFVGQGNEAQFMGGPCQRISIFLSVIDIHVQNAPLSGKVTYFKASPGQFLSALKSESAEHNENVLIGITAGATKVGMRLIAGVLARRIVPFVKEGEDIVRGERISLIQFGSRTDVYLPLSAKIKIKAGDRVVGGETVLAALE
jgi:phosphatidylserine decarboxylase